MEPLANPPRCILCDWYWSSLVVYVNQGEDFIVVKVEDEDAKYQQCKEEETPVAIFSGE